MKGIAGHRIENGFVTCRATFANGIVEKLCAGRSSGHFVINLETCSFGSEKFVTRVFIRFSLLLRGGSGCGRRRSLLRAEHSAPEKCEDRECGYGGKFIAHEGSPRLGIPISTMHHPRPS